MTRAGPAVDLAGGVDDAAQRLLDRELRGGEEAVLLGGEVLVEGVAGDAGAADDVGDGDGAVALLHGLLGQGRDYARPLMLGDELFGEGMTTGRGSHRRCVFGHERQSTLIRSWLTSWTSSLHTAKVPEARQAVPLIDKRKGRWESAPTTRPWQGLERVGVSGAPGSRIDNAPELKLVTSPSDRRSSTGCSRRSGRRATRAPRSAPCSTAPGVYRQAFYDNFADKDECYLQAYDVGVERVEALVVAAAAAEADWTGQLRAGLGALLDFLDAEPDIGRALMVEVHAAGPEALAKRGAGDGAASTSSSTGPVRSPASPSRRRRSPARASPPGSTR